MQLQLQMISRFMEEPNVRHDLTLLHVLDKCQSAGLHLNLEKCQIKKQSVKFYGNMLTTDGLQPDKTNVDAIVKLAPLNNQARTSFISRNGHVSCKV